MLFLLFTTLYVMQNFGQEKQLPEKDDFSFTPLSAAFLTISACGIRDRDLALLIERFEYLVHVYRLNGLDINPDWLDGIELTVERVAQGWRSHFDDREDTDGFEVNLSKSTLFDRYSEMHDIQRGSPHDIGDRKCTNNSSDSQRVVRVLRDFVETLVCDDSPEAHTARKKLYEELAYLNRNTSASVINSQGKIQISPLSSVISSISVNQLLRDFNAFRINVMSDPDSIHTLTLSVSELAEARKDLTRLTLKEEKGLHLLAGLLSHRYLGNQISIEAQIYLKDNGEPGEGGSRAFKQSLSRCELFTRSDIQIAESISGRPAELLGASIIEYKSLDGEPGDMVYAVRTRLKSWGSLIDKVTERMFEGNTITDLSGIAIIVDSEDDVRRVYEQLVRLRWSDAELANMGLKPLDSIRGFEIFKTSDKLGVEHINWRGIKVAGFWGDQCVEIQIKTLDFLRREQASDTPESHSSYRKDRETRREENSRSNPMYNLSRQFIRLVLLGGEPPADMPPNVRLNMVP